MSIIGILKIMEVQEDDMEVQEEAVMNSINSATPVTTTFFFFFFYTPLRVHPHYNYF